MKNKSTAQKTRGNSPYHKHQKSPYIYSPEFYAWWARVKPR